MNPPDSQGGLDAIMAHDLLSNMQRVYHVIPCSE